MERRLQADQEMKRTNGMLDDEKEGDTNHNRTS